MEFTLVHKFLNVQFSVELLIYKTCQLEMIFDLACQICNIHISFLVFQSMEKLLPFLLCSSFRPLKFKCPNLKFHSEESSCISYWNDAFIVAPHSPFLVQHKLFSSLELHALSVVNAVSNYALSPLPSTSIVFLFLDGFNVNRNIILLVI
jgi:hypothetical protein